MTLIFNPQVQNATLNTVRDAIDSGGSAGILEILSGATILATLPLSIPSFADESGGQSVANAIISSVATESGTPDGFRFVTSYGATVFAGDVPDDLDLGGAVISSGQTVGVSSYVRTQGDVQAREFASTVAFPYSAPPLVFDPTPAPSALVEPKDLKLELLRGQDFESDGTTLRTATYDGANVLLDGVPLFASADVKALDLTFDASDNALVVFTDSSDNLFVYDDSDQTTTDLAATGQDPRIHNDRQSSPSIVLSYRRGNDVFYRLNAFTGIDITGPDYWEADTQPAPPVWDGEKWVSENTSGSSSPDGTTLRATQFLKDLFENDNSLGQTLTVTAQTYGWGDNSVSTVSTFVSNPNRYGGQFAEIPVNSAGSATFNLISATEYNAGFGITYNGGQTSPPDNPYGVIITSIVLDKPSP